MGSYNQQQYTYPPYGAGSSYPPPAGYPGTNSYGYHQPPPPQSGPSYAPYPPPMGMAGAPYNYNQPYTQQQQYKPTPGPAFDTEAQQAAQYAAEFMEKKIRSAFVRKVFMLVALMMAITIGIAAVFLFVKPVNVYIAGEQVCVPQRDGSQSCYHTTPAGQWVFYASWGLTLVTLIALMCSQTLRRKNPWNYMAMFVFTFVMSVQVGCICAWWGLSIVLEALAVTGAAVFGLTLAAIFLPWDLTKRGNILGMVSFVVFFIVLITVIVGFFYQNKWWYLVISVVCALLFSAYLVYDIQMVLGNRQFSCSPDEYVFASVQIYLDIVLLFLNLLSIIGIAQS